MVEMNACYMCDNAYTNPELDSDHDLSYISIGKCIRGYRMFMRAGDGRSTTILIEKWIEGTGWCAIGDYQPQYCPNCGRRLKENDNAPA